MIGCHITDRADVPNPVVQNFKTCFVEWYDFISRHPMCWDHSKMIKIILKVLVGTGCFEAAGDDHTLCKIFMRPHDFLMRVS